MLIFPALGHASSAGLRDPSSCPPSLRELVKYKPPAEPSGRRFADADADTVPRFSPFFTHDSLSGRSLHSRFLQQLLPDTSSHNLWARPWQGPPHGPWPSSGGGQFKNCLTCNKLSESGIAGPERGLAGWPLALPAVHRPSWVRPAFLSAGRPGGWGCRSPSLPDEGCAECREFHQRS